MCGLRFYGAYCTLSEIVLLFCLVWIVLTIYGVWIVIFNFQRVLGIDTGLSSTSHAKWEKYSVVTITFMSLQLVEYGSLVVICISSYWGWFHENSQYIRFSAFAVYVIPWLELVTYWIEIYLFPYDPPEFTSKLWITGILIFAFLHSIVFFKYKKQLDRVETRRTESQNRSENLSINIIVNQPPM